MELWRQHCVAHEEAEACWKKKASWLSHQWPHMTLVRVPYSRAWPWNLQAQQFEVVSTTRLDLRSINHIHRTVVVNQKTNLIIAREQYCFHMKWNIYANMRKAFSPSKWRALFGNVILILKLFWWDWAQNWACVFCPPLPSNLRDIANWSTDPFHSNSAWEPFATQ